MYNIVSLQCLGPIYRKLGSASHRINHNITTQLLSAIESREAAEYNRNFG